MTQRGRRNCRNSLLFASLWLAFALCGSVSTAIWAQAPTTAPSFEVASVRQVPAGHGYFSMSPWGEARFTAKNVTMKVLIELAFDVTGDQISGKNVGWIDSGLYDIDAKPEGNAPLSYEQLKPLLRQLLVQRLKLTVHYEQKDVRATPSWLRRADRNLRPARKLLQSGIYCRMEYEAQVSP